MFDHIGIRTANLERAVAFYRATLASLGHVVGSTGADYAGIGPAGAPCLWLHAAGRATGGVHVAFRAADRAAVDAMHAAGLAAGGRDNGAPGLRPDYGANYYAAFLIDPDGNNIEAVCLAPAAG
ncbi:MAG: VOC family protein [Burkholderiales bacterium]|nr:VOC family protein [Burkholderiales bacterium]